MGYAALIQMLMQMSQQIQQGAEDTGSSIGSGDTGNTFKSIGKTTHSKTASAIGGYLSAKKEKKEKRKLKRQIEKTRRITQAMQSRGLAQQEGLTRQATAQQLGGFDVARKEAERLGRSSKQQALDTGQQLGAQLSQDLTNRGLGSTTVGANLQRGISADTSRTLGGINEGLAQMFGNLAMGRAGAEAQGTQQLADLAAQGTNLGIENAQFWLPQMLSSFGNMDAYALAGRRNNSTPTLGQGIDFSALDDLFGQSQDPNGSARRKAYGMAGSRYQAYQSNPRTLNGDWGGGFL